jgi:gamma-glutamyl hydrolase
VIPIFYDQDPVEVRRIFNVINGVLIPGGGANLTPGHKFYDTARQLVDLAVDANDNGDYFPVSQTSTAVFRLLSQIMLLYYMDFL